MTEYTLDVNGKRYSLNEKFRAALEKRAELEYKENESFECWWKVASGDGDWLMRAHDAGDPVLVIETTGKMVPWDRLDQLEMDMKPPQFMNFDDDESDDIDSGNGMAEMSPSGDSHSPAEPDFGRVHFGLTEDRFDEVPSPGGYDPEKIPQKPEEMDENMMVMWVPRHPAIDVTWGAGEAMTSMHNRVEWNVQEKAEQPRPVKDKRNSHDAFESLCKIYGCDLIGEYTPANDIPRGKPGQIQRKGKKPYKEGKYGGGNWSV